MMKSYTYSVCKVMYMEDIEDLRTWMGQIQFAIQCGTPTMTVGDCTNYTEVINRNLLYAVEFLSNPPQKKRKSIVWGDMPDLLTDEELSEYFGWAIPTIQSKRSRGELPRVDGMTLTPKSLLMEMYGSQSVQGINSAKKRTDAVSEKVNSFKRRK